MNFLVFLLIGWDLIFLVLNCFFVLFWVYWNCENGMLVVFGNFRGNFRERDGLNKKIKYCVIKMNIYVEVKW